MEVLIAAATESELTRTIKQCKSQWIEQPQGVFTHGSVSVSFIVTGIGMIRTARAMGSVLAQYQPDLCINAGIAGAFPDKFAIGDVVHVVQETVADFGAEDQNGQLLTPDQLQLPGDLDLALMINHSAANFGFLPKAKGLTVNRVSGHNSTITSRLATYDADIETMEGAAFFYCCLASNVEFLQIRAISNIIEPRNKDNWDIEGALSNLNVQLMEILTSLNV